MSSAYIEQVEQKINSLLVDKKYKEAYKIANELLDRFSHEKKAVKIKKKVENAVRTENGKIVKKGIKEIKKLWKEEKFVEIIKKIKKLLTISPDNSKLLKLEQKAQFQYKKKIIKLQSEFKKSQDSKFNKLLKEDENKLIEELFILEKNNQGNKKVLEITKKFRNKLIIKKIKNSKKLLTSNKFTDIKNLISQLRKIEKKNPIIDEIEEKVNLRKFGSQKEEGQEHRYRSIEQVKVLMKMKKYDKVIQGAEELIKSKKENKEAEKILKKAKKKFFKQTQKSTIESIDKHLPQLKSDYQKDKNAFIKI